MSQFYPDQTLRRDPSPGTRQALESSSPLEQDQVSTPGASPAKISSAIMPHNPVLALMTSPTRLNLALLCCLALLVSGCAPDPADNSPKTSSSSSGSATGEAKTAELAISEREVATDPDGKPVTLFQLTNSHGMEVEVISWGAVVLAIRGPDRDWAGKVLKTCRFFQHVSKKVVKTCRFSCFFTSSPVEIFTLATDSITTIKLVLNPVEPTAPTITPAVAIAIPTATILIAPF